MSESTDYDLALELDGANATDFIIQLLTHIRDTEASIDRINLELAADEELNFEPAVVGAALTDSASPKPDSSTSDSETPSENRSLADGGSTTANTLTAASPDPLEATDSAPDTVADTVADSDSDSDSEFDSFSKTPREWAEGLSLGISTSNIALTLAASDDEPLRVAEIENRLERAGWGDFATSTLHTRLNELRSDGILSREEAREKGNPYQYETTEYGKAALSELAEIVRDSSVYETYYEAVDELQAPADEEGGDEAPIEADVIESDERERSREEGELVVTVDEAGYSAEEVWKAENEPYVLPKDANPGDLRKGVVYEAEVEDVKQYGFFVRVKRTTGKGDVSGLVHHTQLDRRRPSDFRSGMTVFVELENLKPNGDISFHFHGLAGEEDEVSGLEALFSDRDPRGTMTMFSESE